MAVKKEKMFFKSKTFWLNVAGVLIIALQLIADQNIIIDPDIQAIVLAFINILVRFKTNQPIRLR